MIQRFLPRLLNPSPHKSSSIVFHESLGLIQDVEAHLVGEVPEHTPILGSLQRIIWLPTKFVANGFGHKVQIFLTWGIISYAFLLVKILLIRPDPIINEAIIWACFICPMVLVMFPMPSVYAASGVSAEDIQFCIDRLDQRGLNTKSRLTFVQQTLKVFEDRCKSRVTSLMWLVGIAWAGWTYYFVKGLESSAPPTMNGVWAISLASCAVLFLYLAVGGYDSTLNRLFRTIDIACGEILLRDEVMGTEPATE